MNYEQNNNEQQYNPYASQQQPPYNPYGQPQQTQYNPYEQPYNPYVQQPVQCSFAPPLLSFIFGAIAFFFVFVALSDRDLEPFFVFSILLAIPSTVTGIIGLVKSVKSSFSRGIIFAAIGLGCAFFSTIIPFFNM